MDDDLEMEQQEEESRPRKKPQMEEEEGEMESAMTSMIDVTFLLLIFFLLTMKFSTNEKRLKAHLPIDKGQMAVPHKNREDEVEDVRIRLIIPQTGGMTQCLVNERGIGDLQDNGRRLASYLISLKGQIADTKMTIEGEREVPFGDVAIVLNAGLRAEYNEITFAMPQDLYRWEVFR